jgi:hypothetical protein
MIKDLGFRVGSRNYPLPLPLRGDDDGRFLAFSSALHTEDTWRRVAIPAPEHLGFEILGLASRVEWFRRQSIGFGARGSRFRVEYYNLGVKS